MAIAIVQTTGGQSMGGGDSDTASFSVLPSAGNSVFLLVAIFNDTAIDFAGGDVTDNQSNSYALDAAVVEASNAVEVGIFSDIEIGTPSGTFTLTLNPGGSDAYGEWIGVEFSGILDASALDKMATATGNSTAPTVTTAATTQADELVLGCLSGSEDTFAVADCGIDLSSGFTTLHIRQSDMATVAAYLAYKIVSATGTQIFNGGTLSTALKWAIGEATYKAVVAGGKPWPYYQQQWAQH